MIAITSCTRSGT